MLGAICAAIHALTRFHAMTNDAALAMIACRGEGVNSALKGVERVLRPIGCPDRECLVVIVSANFANCHATFDDYLASAVQIFLVTTR